MLASSGSNCENHVYIIHIVKYLFEFAFIFLVPNSKRCVIIICIRLARLDSQRHVPIQRNVPTFDGLRFRSIISVVG